MKKTIAVPIDDLMRALSDDDLLDELKLRGYLGKEIDEIRREIVPNVFKLREWEASCASR